MKILNVRNKMAQKKGISKDLITTLILSAIVIILILVAIIPNAKKDKEITDKIRRNKIKLEEKIEIQ